MGGPFLAAVQRVARGPVDPRPRALAVPDRRAPLLVAGGGARSGAMADEPPGADRLPVHPDDPEHVPGVRDPQRDDGALSALRDAGPAVGMAALEDQRLAAGTCGSPRRNRASSPLAGRMATASFWAAVSSGSPACGVG